MKKEYTELAMEVIVFDAEDVIMTIAIKKINSKCRMP